MTVRVVIADDQQLVRAGFRRILESETGIEVVAEPGDGIEAIAAVHQNHPDVVLMDIRMPQLDGLEATRRLLHDDPHLTRVLVLSTFDLDEYVYEALHAGASGFLLKDAPPSELVAAVRIVAGGDALLAPSITRKVVAEFARRAPQPTPPTAALSALTPREREVLTLLAHGRSNAQIANDLFISDATAKTHVSHVLMKLDLADRVHAVIYAYESGLVQPGRSNHA
jgi:DNA-binding NarL/FixJ family response regulator